MTSNTIAISAVAALLVFGTPAQAYQPGDVFRLDLNQAVLSPQPIGPPARFEPVPVEAREEAPKAEVAGPPPAKAARLGRVPRVAAAKPTAGARPKFVRARSNPLDANAADTRVQVWPCRSGGICNWRK